LRLFGAQVGCASGRAPMVPVVAMENDSLYENDERYFTEIDNAFIVTKRDQKIVNRNQLCFFTCCVLTMISACLVLFSTVRIQMDFNGLYNRNMELRQLFLKSTQHLKNMKTNSSELNVAKNLLTSEFSDFCLSSTQLVLGSNATELSREYLDALLELDGINTDDVFNDLSSSIYEAYEIITSIGHWLQFSDEPNSWWFLCSLQYASLIFLGLLVFLINASRSVKESSKIDTDNKERSCYKVIMLFVSILFALFAILAWVAASTFFAGATLTVDFAILKYRQGKEYNKS